MATPETSFSFSSGIITAFIGTETEIDIPSTIGGVPVTSIGNNAFENKASITSVIIPSGVTSIGDYAFRFCTSLASINIPDGVITVGTQAFRGCTSLTSITFPNSVTSAGSITFSDCTSLATVVLGTGITVVDYAIFYDCTSLRSLTILNSEQQIEVYNNSFVNVPSDIVIYVMDKSLYTDADWAPYLDNMEYAYFTSTSAFTFDETTQTIVSYDHTIVENDELQYYNVVIPEVFNVNGTDYNPLHIGANCFLDKEVEKIVLNDYIDTIGDNAFKNTGITSIAFPSTIQSIGNEVCRGCLSLTSARIDTAASINSNLFRDCTSLNNVTITSLVTTIKQGMFQECSSLTSINLPSSITSIESYAFYNSGISSITIPSAVTSIGSYAFYGTSLTSISIPASITSLADNTLSNCSSLTDVSLPEGLTLIGNNCFSGCSALKKLTLPSTITTLGNNILSGVTGFKLTSLNTSVPDISTTSFSGASISRISVYNSSLITYKQGINWSTYSSIIRPIHTPQEYFTYNSTTHTITSYNHVYQEGDLDYCKNIIIPDIFEINGVDDTTLVIGQNAFFNNKDITSVLIPDGITIIDNQAFWGCSSITSINIPNSVIGIYGGAFHYCSSITSIVIPNGITLINGSTFSDCTSLTSVTIPTSVIEIGTQAFQNCTSLISLEIPISVTTIGAQVFQNCTSLSSIEIPVSVTTIGNYAFSNCPKLDLVIKGSPQLGNTVFSYFEEHTAKSVTFLNSVAPTITNDTFNNYTNKIYCLYSNLNTYKSAWTSVVSKIYPAPTPTSCFTFDEASGTITSFTHTPQGGELEYYHDIVMPEVFPISDTEKRVILNIGAECFKNNTNITKLVTPYPIETIRQSSFENCSNITKVDFMSTIISIEEHAFDGCSSLNSISLPSSITNIGTYAFAETGDIPAITIPSNIVNISPFILSNSGIQNIILGDAVKTIGTRAFEGTNISSISFPNTITDIGAGAFSDCTSLTSVAIPNGTTVVRDYTYQGCSNLASVTIPDSIIALGIDAFEGCSSLENITFPSSLKTIKERCFSNSGLISLVVPNSITSIETDAFKGCSSLASANVGNGIVSLTQTFVNCTSLTSITMPNSIGSINGVFEGCSSLSTIAIPSSVSTIGNNTFKGTNFTTIDIPSSVSTIGTGVFDNCLSLQKVNLHRKKHPTLQGLIFNNCPSLTKLYVDKNIYLADYKAAANWSTYSSLFDAYIFETPHNYFIYNKETATVESYIHDYEVGDPNECLNILVPEFFTIDNVEYPATYIGQDCFSSIPDITSIEFSETTTTLSYNTFYNCPQLKTIKLPPSINVVPNGCITECFSLENIIVDVDNTNYADDEGVLYSKDFTRLIQYPSNKSNLVYTVKTDLTEISNYAFNKCDNLIYLKVNDLTPAAISSDSFLNYPSTFNIKVDVSKVSEYKAAWPKYSSIIIAFYINENDFVLSGTTIVGYTGSETGELVVPSNIDVTTIRGIAATSFLTNNDFNSINIPNSISTIENNVFGECSNLSNITVEGSNPNFSSLDGVLYNKTKTEIIAYPRAKSGASFSIPNTVTVCAPYTFNNCSNLNSILNVKSVGEGSFKGTNINTITIINPINKFNKYLFKDCVNLVTINYNGTINSIEEEAFYNCQSMTDFLIPITVTTIGNRAFYNCTSLRVVSCFRETPPTSGSDIFDNTNQYLKITVSPSALISYRTTWAEYASHIFSEEPVLPSIFETLDFSNLYTEEQIKNSNVIKVIAKVKKIVSNSNIEITLDNNKKDLTAIIANSGVHINSTINKDNR